MVRYFSHTTTGHNFRLAPLGIFEGEELPGEGCLDALVRVLREAGRPLLFREILAALREQNFPWGARNVHHALGQLRRRGLAARDGLKKPFRYRLMRLR